MYCCHSSVQYCGEPSSHLSGVISLCWDYKILSSTTTSNWHRWILHQLIQDKHFILDQVNFEIENLSYSVNDKTSKPQILMERMLWSKGQLSGKASEIWTLFRLLPLIVGSYVPPKKYWNCYILLLKVVDLIMVPVVRRLWIPSLEEKITEFLATFHELFPDGVIPKMHFLVHYPSLMLKYGPIIHLSCIRFEAKHQYFKKVSTVVATSRTSPNHLLEFISWDSAGSKLRRKALDMKCAMSEELVMSHQTHCLF